MSFVSTAGEIDDLDFAGGVEGGLEGRTEFTGELAADRGGEHGMLGAVDADLPAIGCIRFGIKRGRLCGGGPAGQKHEKM